MWCHDERGWTYSPYSSAHPPSCEGYPAQEEKKEWEQKDNSTTQSNYCIIYNKTRIIWEFADLGEFGFETGIGVQIIIYDFMLSIRHHTSCLLKHLDHRCVWPNHVQYTCGKGSLHTKPTVQQKCINEWVNRIVLCKQWSALNLTHLKVSKIVRNALDFDLLGQKIAFVEKEDDRDRSKTPVVDNGVKDVNAFHQPVSDSVL